MAFFLCVKYLHRVPRECPGVTIDDLLRLKNLHEELMETEPESN